MGLEDDSVCPSLDRFPLEMLDKVTDSGGSGVQYD